MKHSEWRGDKELIERLLKRTGLYNAEDANEYKTAMKYIIWYKYVELMTVDETLARLIIDHNIDISVGQYYRIFNRALKMLEKKCLSKSAKTLIKRK